MSILVPGIDKSRIHCAVFAWLSDQPDHGFTGADCRDPVSPRGLVLYSREGVQSREAA